MSTELNPAIAAELALDAYTVNAGVERDLKDFLNNDVFSSTGFKTVLNAQVGGRILKATKDGFGLCALGAGKYQGDLFFIFRGTTDKNSNADVLTDARIGICMSKTGLPVHIGFNHTFNSMLPEMRKILSEVKITGYVHCIGHSLGGAVASLAADWVSKNSAYKPKLYTFGAPRVGTDWFVKSTTSSIREANMHRVYHRTDPVPMVALYPFMQAPYSSFAHFIYSAEPLTSGEAHRMGKYARSVNGTSWKKLSDRPDQPYNIEKAIESWLKSKSPVDSSSATFWRWVDSAIIFVLKKVAMGALLALQGAFIGFMTLADKIAYILAKGIQLADHISIWVELLMRKLMQALHMKVASSKKELTRDLIRYVLLRITEKANQDARNALRKLK
jgi:triacylglycerol lipase